MGRFIDLTGQKFGRLVVVGRCKEKQGKFILWLCQCDCGSPPIKLRGQNLRDGHTKSCGCIKVENLTGQHFGRLSVLQRMEGNSDAGKSRWLCQCDCGQIVPVIGASLKNGNTKSCGCLKEEPENLAGMRFGMLIVLEKCPDEREIGQHVKWNCLCDCGNIISVIGTNLKIGHTKSCGCINRRELTGMQFGKLTVLRESEERKNGQVLWVCRCECGTEKLVSTRYLVSNQIRSCGCYKSQFMSEKLKKLDLTGQRFGHLIVIDEAPPMYYGINRIVRLRVWNCVCDCGNTIVVRTAGLNHGWKTSCGCSKLRNLNLTDEERLKHRYVVGGDSQSKWRQLVLERDDYTCRCCGKNNLNDRNVEFRAHHKDGWSWCLEKRFDVDNGVTLCKECHDEFHHEYGIKKNTEMQYKEFEKWKHFVRIWEM